MLHSELIHSFPQKQILRVCIVTVSWNDFLITNPHEHQCSGVHSLLVNGHVTFSGSSVNTIHSTRLPQWSNFRSLKSKSVGWKNCYVISADRHSESSIVTWNICSDDPSGQNWHFTLASFQMLFYLCRMPHLSMRTYMYRKHWGIPLK